VGLWDDFTDAVSDAADAVGGAVSDAAGSTYDAVTQGGVGDALGAVGRAVDTATFGLAGGVMDATDDYVFDTVDYVTGGVVNVDFDDGQFSASTGIDGVAQFGASLGEAGITADGEALIGGSFDFGMTDQGFLASGAAGIDWGPLPYAAGHVELDANGDVRINGQVQGTLPTPYGIFSGEASGGFTSTADGWGGYLNSQGSWQLPSGVTLGGGEHFSYMQNADGDSQLSVGVNGSVSYMGATVRGGVDYDRLEQDGDVVENVDMHGSVDALGVHAEGSVDYAHANVDGVDRSDWSSDGDVDADLGKLAQAGARFAQSELGGDDAGDVGGMADGLDDVGDVGGMAGGFDDMAGGFDDMGAASFDPVDAMAAAPASDFDSAIQTADSVEQSMDDLSQDLSQDL
jgi:hypothetical protein